jgi:CheY-specific phosphatase CheX
MPNSVVRSELENLLEAASYDVLETMCFFGVLGDADSINSTEEQITAKVLFRGDAAGEFRATLDYSAAWSIAANFMGEEPLDVELAHMQAVICELANMICGAVLSNYRKDGLFQLSTPEIAGCEESQSPQEVSRVFELESGSMKVSITLENSGAPAFASVQ